MSEFNFSEGWSGWERDPSTRTSVHAITKYYPFRAATSTSASTLLTVDRGIPSVNLVTNPRIEDTTISMYTATGSAISRDTGQQSSGAASLLVNPDNSAAGEGVYWTSGTLAANYHQGGSYLMATCEIYGASASGTVHLQIQDSDGTALATSATHSLGTSWTKISVVYKLPKTSDPAAYRVAVLSQAQHNINWYVDKIHVEQRADGNVVDYVDGAQGLNYEWEGTAETTKSRRRAGLEIIRGIFIRNESTTVADIVYVAFDQTATSTTGIAVPGAGTGSNAEFYSNWPLDFRSKVSVIAAQNTPTVSGVIWGIHSG